MRPLLGNRLKYKGQEQQVAYFQFLGTEDEIRVDQREFIHFQWVPVQKLYETVHAERKSLAHIAQAAAKLGYKADTVEMEWIPKTLIETDESTGMAVAELIDLLDQHDDVSRVYSNLA
jgi:transcriptional/translational regulatory protein YebC/TACO1